MQVKITQEELAKQLLSELQTCQKDLCQILLNKNEKISDYITDRDDLNFENDYTMQQLIEYLNSGSETIDTTGSKAFMEVMRMRGQENFSLIMQKLGQQAPVSIQDFLELLYQVPRFDETILIYSSDLKKDMVTLPQQLKYISSMVLKIIIQSTPLPLEKTIQITSLQEIKKRVHKLRIAIEQKLRQPSLLLEYSKINSNQ